MSIHHRIAHAAARQKRRVKLLTLIASQEGYGICPNCGKDLGGFLDGCSYCGWTKKCPECGAEWLGDLRGCWDCGFGKTTRN